MTRARSLSQLANSNVFSVDANNSRVGIGSTLPDGKLDVDGDILVGTAITIGKVSGIISATSYRGDGSQLTGVDSSNLIDSGDTNRVAANTSGIVVTGITTVVGAAATVRLQNSDTSLIADQTIGGLEFEKTDGSGAGAGVVGGLRMFSEGSIGESTYLTLSTSDSSTNDNERVRVSSGGLVTITTDTNSASPASSGDNLVIKDSNGCGLSILSGDSNSQNIYLGSTSDNDGVRLEGFRNSGSPYFNIYTNGSERLRISGVGTVMLRANQGSAETNIIRFEDTDTSAAADQKFGQLQWYSNDASGAGACVKGEIYVAAQDTTPDGYMVFATHDGGSSTVATERMRIISDGRIGVGTDKDFNAGSMTLFSANSGEGTATGQLELKDTADHDATPTGGIIFSGRHTAGGNAIFAGIRGFKSNTSDGDVDGSLAFDVRKQGAVAYEAMRINEDAEVGIGTHTPQRGPLHIHERSSGDVSIHMTNTTSGTTSSDGFTIFAGQSNGDAGFVNRESGGDIEFITNNGTNVTQRIIIKDSGHLYPNQDDTYDLGGTSNRWANIYSADLQLSNEGKSNDVDGTWGQYTIQEGENDLFLINRRNGKSYKFVLEEVN